MAAEPTPTATPALTSLVRRCSLPLSSSLLSLMARFLWRRAPHWKRHEGTSQNTARTQGRAGTRVGSGGARGAIGLGGYRKDASADRARAAAVAEGCAA